MDVPCGSTVQRPDGQPERLTLGHRRVDDQRGIPGVAPALGPDELQRLQLGGGRALLVGLGDVLRALRAVRVVVRVDLGELVRVARGEAGAAVAVLLAGGLVARAVHAEAVRDGGRAGPGRFGRVEGRGFRVGRAGLAALLAAKSVAG